MSIAALHQVYEEVRRLSIAGSDLAAGDFRLEKLVAPLEKSAAKAPVFGRVAEAVRALTASNAKTSAAALLELATLVTAIEYTQGATGAQGELEAIVSPELGLGIADTSARVLKPLIEALTSTGAGRLELIRDAHERGAFLDLRLLRHAIGALDDPYAEVRDFVATEILPAYGKPIYAEVRERFDPKGKGGHIRRLQLLHRLDPEATRPIVDHALEHGSKDVRLAALGCLDGRDDAADILLEQLTSRTSAVREVAYAGLAPIDRPDVVKLVLETLAGSEGERVASHVGRNPNPEVAAFVVTEARRLLDEICASKVVRRPAAKKTTAAKQTTAAKKTTSKKKAADDRPAGARLNVLLLGLAGRTDPEAQQLLIDAFERRDKLAVTDCAPFDGSALVERVTAALVRCGSSAGLELVGRAGVDIDPRLIRHTFIASSRVAGPKATFDVFAPAYTEQPSGNSAAAKRARDRAEVIGGVLRWLGGGRKNRYYGDFDDLEVVLDLELDPRWLDATIEQSDLDTVATLARPGHTALNTFLSRMLRPQMNKQRTPVSTMQLFECMIRIEHPERIELFIAAIRTWATGSKFSWETYSLLRLIPTLPPEAAAPLEALIPEINERCLDNFVDNLDELKRASPPTA